jgi:cation diffusion facilitator CzcD-associated flavoprotein CzcO
MANRDLRFVVLGAGMSGILAAIRLREAGYDRVTILEKAATLGGTWRENRYAGLYCDVPAHAYTYSFAPNPEWSSYLAPGPEIQRYFEDVAHRYGLHDIMRFNEEVTLCRWVDGHWRVETKAGAHHEADVVIAATGVLHHPRLPGIEGVESFAGPCFHSARWQDGIELAGKRVGVLGTGSTGVQLVSALAGVAAHVDQFCRSPQWIMPLDNPRYTDEQKAAFRADPKLIDAVRFDETYLANVQRFTDAVADPDADAMRIIEQLVKDNLENSVKDPVLREKLRPTYRAACKRLVFSSDYYAAVQRPNVEVVTERITRVEPQGVRTADGVLHPLDVLILATGFHADRFMRPMQIVGQGGVQLEQFWARKPHAYYAITMPDFPNLFMLNGPGAPVGNFSLIDVAERQWDYIAQLIERLDRGEGRAIAPKHSAVAAYDERRDAAARHTIFGSGCSSWYLDNEGVPNLWPWSYQAFADAMARPDHAAFELTGG